jgi:hypothetical protein
MNTTATLNEMDLSALFGIDIESAASDLPAVNATDYFDQKCNRCNGTGKYGRHGKCFSCDGRGKTAGAFINTEDFSARYPEVMAWINTNPNNNFAASMAQTITRTGRLSPNQLSACQRCAEGAKRADSAPDVDVSKIAAAFAAAFGNGIKRPKLRLDTFTFSRATDTGANPGAIYVKEGEEYLGKVTAGKFIATRDCGDERKARVIAVASAPDKAAKAYGMCTGSCSCCGRTLTNHASIDLGIGPICAGNFGW